MQCTSGADVMMREMLSMREIMPMRRAEPSQGPCLALTTLADGGVRPRRGTRLRMQTARGHCLSCLVHVADDLRH
jgi:hypothetical protein